MTTAVVDLSALASNATAIRSLLKSDTRLLAAIKADAYGHGAVQVAQALEHEQVDWFGVATPSELLELRAAGIGARLMLLTPVLDRVRELVDAEAVFSLPDRATLERLLFWRVPRGTRLHLKVDTGLGRLGLPPEDAVALAIDAERAGYEIEGLWTHLSAAENDPEVTASQAEQFRDAEERLKRAGIEPQLRHASNSAGILAHPELELDMVRSGLLLYGYSPLPQGAPDPLAGKLKRVMSLLAPVTFTKRVRAGQGISYNHLWHADRDTNILTVRCGYADGYRRLLSGRSWASLHGQRLQLRGRVAMDQLLLDAGDIEVQPGELVTLMGGSGPGADELGELAESNAYDILSSVTKRVTRQYVRNAG